MKKTVAVLSLLALQACAGRHSESPELGGAKVTPRYIPHTIEYPGETLGAIAKWYTGSANNWTELSAANPGLDPRKLRLGQIVNIPEELAVKREPFGADFIGQNKAVESVQTAPPPQMAKVSDTATASDMASPTMVEENSPQIGSAGQGEGAPPTPGVDDLLYQAVLLEDVAMLKDALGRGANIEYRQQNRTMLGIAAQSPSDVVLKALIESGADVNAIDGIGHSPLMRAVDLGATSNIEALIAAQANLNHRNSDGDTALLLAMRNQNEAVALMLLNAGADPSIADNDGNSPGLRAAEMTSLPLIKALGEKKANLDLSNAAYSPLTFAIAQENAELLKALLDAGANPNAKTAADQVPLHMAIGKPELTKLLLAAKADPTIKDTYERAPLERAIRDGDVGSAEALIGAGADVNGRTLNGSPYLQEARFSSNPEMVALLEKNGAVAE